MVSVVDGIIKLKISHCCWWKKKTISYTFSFPFFLFLDCWTYTRTYRVFVYNLNKEEWYSHIRILLHFYSTVIIFLSRPWMNMQQLKLHNVNNHVVTYICPFTIDLCIINQFIISFQHKIKLIWVSIYRSSRLCILVNVSVPTLTIFFLELNSAMCEQNLWNF